MKLATLLLGGIAFVGLAIGVGCEADVDTASNQPPSNVTIENNYDDDRPRNDVRYGTPERDQNIRIETNENNTFEADEADRNVDIEEDINIDRDYDSDVDRDVDID